MYSYIQNNSDSSSANSIGLNSIHSTSNDDNSLGKDSFDDLGTDLDLDTDLYLGADLDLGLSTDLYLSEDLDLGLSTDLYLGADLSLSKDSITDLELDLSEDLNLSTDLCLGADLNLSEDSITDLELDLSVDLNLSTDLYLGEDLDLDEYSDLEKYCLSIDSDISLINYTNNDGGSTEYQVNCNSIDEVTEVILSDLAKNVLLNDFDESLTDSSDKITNCSSILKESMKKSVILHKENISLPNESTVTLMDDHLLLDTNNAPIETQDKILAENKTQLKHSGVKRKCIEDEKNISQNSKIQKISKKNSSSSKQQSNMQNSPEGVSLKKLSYTCIDTSRSNLTIGIYEGAIEAIDIDSGKLLENAILEEFNDEIEAKGFVRSSMSISETYSSICNYIADKSSTYIHKILKLEGVDITAGMSVSDIRHKYISNRIFFTKFDRCCREIEEDINIDKHNQEDFLSLIQNVIESNSGNYLNININNCDIDKKNKISRLLKCLIMRTVQNLAWKIKSVVKEFSTDDVLKYEFIKIYGVYVTKSFLINAINIYIFNKLITGKEPIEVNYDLIEKKLEKAFKKSVIFDGEKTILPNDSLAMFMTNHLLLDMDAVDISVLSKLIGRNIDKQPSTLLEQSTPLEQFPLISPQSENLQIYSEVVMPETLKIIETNYVYKNIYAESYKNLYDCVIDKIIVDENRSFGVAMLTEFNNRCKSRGYNEPYVDTSLTYSNIRKYISDKISSYINYIIRVEDVIIKPGMSISDFRREHISNNSFFDKLNRCCKEVGKEISKIPHEQFLPMVQRKIYLSQDSVINIIMAGVNIKRKNALTTVLKDIILDTVHNLPNKIKLAIEALEENDILDHTFSTLHNVRVTKSFIRDVIDVYTIDNVIAKSRSLEIDESLIKTKLEMAMEKYVILNEGKLILPNMNTVKLMADYLLLDLLDDRSYRTKYYSEVFFEDRKQNVNNDQSNVDVESIDCTEHLTPGENIYEYAIKVIDIDEEKEFMGLILKEFDKTTENSDKSFNNFATTYENIRKYVSDEICPYFNKVIHEADVLIVPGMSVLYIKNKCISNTAFLSDIYQHCKMAEKNISKIPSEKFLTLFDSDSILGINIDTIDSDRKDKISQALKSLIMDTLIYLPQKIMYAINKFDSTDVLKGVFKPFHGLHVTKSLIRNVMDIYAAVNKERIENKSLESVNNLPEKSRLENMVRRSVIMPKEVTLSPNEHTVKFIVDHLLSDMASYRKRSNINE